MVLIGPARLRPPGSRTSQMNSKSELQDAFNPLWSQIVGIDDRRFRPYDAQTVTVNTTEPRHPITADLPDSWTIQDETYALADADPASGNTILLTTEHDPSMRTLAWTRTHGKARVLCLQNGHDDLAWSNPNLRSLILRGIHWCAGRL